MGGVRFAATASYGCKLPVLGLLLRRVAATFSCWVRWLVVLAARFNR